MNDVRTCEQCGAVLDSRAPEGLCPRCVLATVARDAIEAVPSTHSVDSALPLPQSKRFGDYELQEEIARGGMGVVYKARQISLDRTVAVKMILFGSFASEASVQRPYFSMDYIEGQSLTELVRDNPLSATRAAECVKMIAEAIHYAHQRGILHRDLKPSNVLIDAGLRPHITDFGLAKNLKGHSELTLTGQALGSPCYIPPEQAAGRHVDVGPHSDVYSMGAILYHLLTGRPPFVAETVTETLQQVVSSEPAAPRLLNPRVPRDLQTICLKCLSKEPHRRYHSAEALGQDLQRWLADEPIVARPIGSIGRCWRWCRRKPVLAGLAGSSAVLLLAVLIGSSVATLRISRERQRAEQNAKNEKQQRGRADLSAAESRTRLVRQYVGNGNRLVDEGDLLGALPWFAEALNEEQNNPARADIHRLRLALTIRQCPMLVQVYFGHRQTVNYAEFSPDGKWVVSASEDKTAQIWDATTGELVNGNIKDTTPMLHAEFSPDGRWIVTASHKSARVWNAATGEPRTTNMMHSQRVNHAEFSRDGLRVLTVSQDGTARVWDATTGKPLAPPLLHTTNVTHGSFSADGRLVATACQDETVRIWNAATGEPRTPPLRLGAYVYVAQFSPDGRQLLTAAANGTVWDVATCKTIAVLRHRERLTDAAFSPDGRQIVTTSFDQTARVWDAATGVPVTLPMRHSHTVLCASFSPDARLVATACEDGTVRIWDATTGELVEGIIRHSRQRNIVRFSSDGRRIVTAGDSGTQRIWDLSGHKQPVRLEHPPVVYDAAFSPDGRVGITLGFDDTARLWDLATGEQLTSLNLASVRCAQFSSDSRRVVLGKNDGLAEVWDWGTGQRSSHSMRHSGPVNHVEFSPNGQRLVTASGDASACVWDMASGRRICQVRQAGPIAYASFTPDGKHLVTATLNSPLRPLGYEEFGDRREGRYASLCVVQQWDAETGKPTTAPLQVKHPVSHAVFTSDRRWLVTSSEANYEDQTQVRDVVTGQRVGRPLQQSVGIRYACFSQDSRWVVTSGGDFTARLWDAATGQPVTPALNHRQWVYHAAFSSDGRLIATGSVDGSARVWDAATGEPIGPLLKHGAAVERIFFTPQADRLLTATSDGTAHVWDLPKEARPLGDDILMARLLANREVAETGTLVLRTGTNLEAGFYRLRAKYPADFRAFSK